MNTVHSSKIVSFRVCSLGPSWSCSYDCWIYNYIYINVHVQSVHITTKVVSSNSVHGEVNSMQHHVIKFVSDL
jgi:hypothetical protein